MDGVDPGIDFLADGENDRRVSKRMIEVKDVVEASV